MSNKLFCGGLAWATDDEGLRGAFEKFGEVTDATVVLDRETGRSRGFGFVTFANPDDAEKARAAMDGAQLDGRTLRVDSAQERQGGGGRGPRRDGGGGGGFRGGRGGGGGGGGFRGDRDGGGRGDFGGGGGRGDFGGGGGRGGGRGGDFGGGRGGDFGGRGRRED